MTRIVERILRTPARVYAAVAAVILLAGTCAIAGLWLFHVEPARRETSVWRSIVSDRSTIGFLRLAIVAVALYAVTSVAALIVSGRWLRAFSTTGFEADAPVGADTRLSGLQARLRYAEDQRDRAFQLLEEYLRG